MTKLKTLDCLTLGLIYKTKTRQIMDPSARVLHIDIVRLYQEQTLRPRMHLERRCIRRDGRG